MFGLLKLSIMLNDLRKTVVIFLFLNKKEYLIGFLRNFRKKERMYAECKNDEEIFLVFAQTKVSSLCRPVGLIKNSVTNLGKRGVPAARQQTAKEGFFTF